MKDTSVIPEGPYCYTIERVEDGKVYTKNCPYWSRNKDKEDWENGYCSYLEQGDWEVEGLSLLWDGCKECNINWGDDNVQVDIDLNNL